MTTGNSREHETVTIGIIGFGHRLRSIMNRLLAIAPGRVRVAAIYDSEPKAALQARELFGEDLIQCDSEEAFFALPEIDWVFIGSPNYLHVRHVVQAIEAGKDVFCEKPLATSFEDCLVVKNCLQTSGRTFAFGLVLRYSPFYQKIKQILDRGELGQIISFEFNETLDFNHGGRRIFSTWRRNEDLAGSHLLEKCCHDLDLANWLMDSLPVQVASFGGLDFFHPVNAGHVERVGPAPDGRMAYRPYATDANTVHPFSEGATIVDNQVAILQYANGVRATFHTNCNTAMRERRFYLCGTEGTLHGDAYTGIIEWRRIGYDTEVQRVQVVSGGGQGHAGGDEIMVAGLMNTMYEGAPFLADVDDGIRACAVAFAIDRAMQKKSVVDLTEIWRRCGVDPYDGQPRAASPASFSEAQIPVSSGV